MPKITRSTQKVFGDLLAASNNIAEFGSLKAGSVAYSKDPADIQTTEYLNGWAAALESNKAPPLQDMNALFFLLSRQLAYAMQAGVPEYDAGTTYYIGSIVSDGAGRLYVSKTDDNVGNALTSLANWKRHGESMPIGSVIATFPNLTGAYACTATTVADDDGFVVCGGQTMGDATSPMNGQVIPNINSDVFLMGNATSGTAGGANSKTISVSAAFPTNHTHAQAGFAKIAPVSSSGMLLSWKQTATAAYPIDGVLYTASSIPSAGSTASIGVQLGGATSNVDSSPLTIDSTGTNDIRPKYITARYIMRVK